jgi:acyl dehydratase
MAGLYFEEFKAGMIFDHSMHRTITEADNVLFSTMTHNPSALHLDAEYMKKSQYGQRLVNSCLTLSLMVGISTGDTTLGTTIANLGWDNVRFPKPLFHGDTIRVQTEVIEMRESRSKPDRGIVTLIHRCFNQHDEEVASCLRLVLMMKKPPAKK